jgi:hypothetical protein
MGREVVQGSQPNPFHIFSKVFTYPKNGTTKSISGRGGKMKNTRKDSDRFSIGVLIALVAAFSACSSAKVKTSQDLRAKEYEELKETISQYHENSYFGPDKPWLFSAKDTDTYFQDFAEKNCRSEDASHELVAASVCEQRFKVAVNAQLSQTYFAADLTAIKRKCIESPLICGDLQTIEVLFRNLHNAGIRESEREKLARIEEWNRRKLTDDELESALHINFKFLDGRLVITLPDESV